MKTKSEAYGGGHWQKYLKIPKSNLLEEKNLNFDREKLVDLLHEAFCAGQDCCFELKDQVLDELLCKVRNVFTCATFSDLCGLPSGRKIFHSLFGEGLVIVRNNERYVQFNGFSFNLSEPDNSWPWTEKVRIV